MNNKTSSLPYFAGIFSAVIFGFTFLFSKIALEYINPIYFLSLRFGIAFFCINLLGFFKIIKLKQPLKNFFKILPVSLFVPVLSFLFEIYGIKFATSSEAGVVIATIPIFVMIFSKIILKEKIKKIKAFFLFISLCGVLLIVISEGIEFNGRTLGILLLIGATISSALYNIFSKKLSVKFSPWEITYNMMFCGFLFFTMLSVFLSIIERELFFLYFFNKTVLISSMYLGVFASLIAFFLVNYTLNKISATNTAVFAYLATIISVFAGIFILNENLNVFIIIGSVLIIVGIWGINYFERKMKRGE